MNGSMLYMLADQAGPDALRVLRTLWRASAASKRGGLVTSFIRAHPKVVGEWINGPLNDHLLQSEQIGAWLKTPVSVVAEETGLSERQLISVTNRALYKAVRFASPDGGKVSPAEVQFVDQDIEQAFQALDPSFAER